MGEKIREARSARNELLAVLGREPTEEELANRLRWSHEKTRLTMSSTADTMSLGRPLTGKRGEGTARLGDFAVDEVASGAPEGVLRDMVLTRERVRQLQRDAERKLRYASRIVPRDVVAPEVV